MRKLERIIRNVRNRGDSKLLLAVLVAAWLAAASHNRPAGSAAAFDGFGESARSAGCGLMFAVNCSSRMLLEPAILARHIEMKPLGTTKPPHRPARFGFHN